MRFRVFLCSNAIAASLLLCCASLPLRAALVLQLRVVEGEGDIYATGARATRGVTVLVTDENGAPVEGAAVSFQLPADGPGGRFANDMTSFIATTKADGRATAWGMKWNNTPGPFDIRITAAKDQARAGILCGMRLSTEIKSGGQGSFKASHHHFNKWLLLAAAAGGGAAAGMALRGSGAHAAAGPIQTPLQIGAPSIIIGHP